jgi:hypothetical protein
MELFDKAADILYKKYMACPAFAQLVKPEESS